jgi:hypothetical protein
VLSLKNTVINLAPEFVIIVTHCHHKISWSHVHHNMIIQRTFVIKHCKFLSLNEHFLFLFNLNKKNVMLTNIIINHGFLRNSN